MTRVTHARWPWLVLVALLLGGLAVAVAGDDGPQTSAERARSLAEGIKCPTCQGQSVASSDAPAARSIKTEIARRIEEGQTDQEIRDYIVGLYPDSSLTPPRSGVAGLVWFLPVALFVGAVGGLAAVFRSWRSPPDAEISDADRELVEQARRASGS